MPTRSVRCMVGLIVLAGVTSARCEENEATSRLAESLRDWGYENIQVKATDSVVVVWCENRRIRYPVVWMVQALWLAASSSSQTRNVRVVAEKRARPVVSLTASAEAVREWMRGELSTAAFRRQLLVEFAGDASPTQRANASFGRVDLALGPGRLLSTFGDPAVWVRAHFDLSAALTNALAPGLAAYGRVFIPLHNRGAPVDNEYRYNEMRPGSFLLSYFRPIGSAAFSTITVGYFELANWRYDSYGIMVDLEQLTPDGRWAMGGSVGYVGWATYRVLNTTARRYRIWEIGWPPQDRPYAAFVSYRFDEIGVKIVGRWGKFLFGDRGWRVDVERKFGEIGLTIFGIKSDARLESHARLDRLRGVDPVDRGNVRLLGGVRIEIPLYPRERSMPARFRVTAVNSYAWSYRYRVGHVGVDVNTGHGVEDLLSSYNPTEILINLERARAQVRNWRGVTTSRSAENESP